MKILLRNDRNRGLTLAEVLVILAVLAVLAVSILPQLVREKRKALRIHCTNNLLQISVSYSVSEGESKETYPVLVAALNGGTKDFVTGPNAFRHFQVMSNELVTPKILICPAESDRMRAVAPSFDSLSNSNISYFVGIDANKTNPRLMLSGDRNITNGTLVKNGLLDITTNDPAGWTAELHHGIGNIGLADGSIQQLSLHRLRDTVANTGFATNRLQMPVLTP
jgi:hypothetical protein